MTKQQFVEVPLNIALFKGATENSVALEITSAMVDYEAMTPLLWSLSHILRTLPAVTLSREQDPKTQNITTKTLPIPAGLAHTIRREMINTACMSTTIH